MGKGDGTCPDRPGTDISAMELTREERAAVLHGSRVRAILAEAVADRPWQRRKKTVNDGMDAYQAAVDGTRQSLPYAVQNQLAVIYAENQELLAPFEPTKAKAQVCITTDEVIDNGVCPVHGPVKQAQCSEERSVTVPAEMEIPAEFAAEYAQRVRDRDEAKQALVFYNQRWIIKEAYNNPQFKGRGVSTTDLIQAGNEGMLEAVQQFEVEKGNTFLTYAKNKVMMRMQRLCENQAANKRGVRPPSDVENEINEISQVLDQLRGRSHRDPTMEELTEAVNKRRKERGRKHEIKLERVEQAYRLHHAKPVSMQAQLRSDEGDSLDFGATLESQVTTSGMAENNELASMMSEAFDSMDPQERLVMEAYLGIATGEEMKTREVVELTGLKTNQVLELQQRAEAAVHRTFARHGHNKNTLLSLVS